MFLLKIVELEKEYAEELSHYNELQDKWKNVVGEYTDSLIYEIKASEAKLKALRKVYKGVDR